MERMEIVDINPILTEATTNLHEKNTTRMKTSSKLMQELQTTKGLTQAWCLSPTNFKIYLDRKVKE
jgi:hypothetical protein